MNYSSDYLQDLLVRMAYHSSGIEGNTLSLPETISILTERMLPNSRRSIIDFYKIENHKQTFELLLDKLKTNDPLIIDTVLEFHALLMDRMLRDKGEFKSHQFAIRGTDFDAATPQETPQLIEQWIKNTLSQLDNSNSQADLLEALADSHIQFERIHPFTYGNGYTGRILLIYLSMRYLKIPIIINQDKRKHYIEALDQQDIDGLVDLFKQSLTVERERINHFKNN